MKEKIALFAIIASVSFIKAQNTFPWSASGNVGIGTITPAVPLEVQVNAVSGIPTVFRYAPNSQNLFFSPYLSQAGFNPISLNGDAGILWNDQLNTADNSNLKAGMVIAPKSGKNLGMRMNSLGLLGLNQPTPLARLHVVQNNSLENGAYDGVISELNSSLGREYESTFSFLAKVQDVNLNGFGLYDKKSASMKFFVMGDGTTRIGNYPANTDFRGSFPGVLLSVGGKVMIGDKLPTNNYADALLSVDGKIVSRSVYVQVANWADYVFEKDYKLKSLDEVEQYIAQNQHLPDIPSEAVIKQSGADMMENDAMLLKKIEELTLYVIQLKKELAEQQKKIIMLEQK
jgi:hypothetical protein